MIRYIAWNLFLLVTLGAISFDVRYEDGAWFYHEGWII